MNNNIDYITSNPLDREHYIWQTPPPPPPSRYDSMVKYTFMPWPVSSSPSIFYHGGQNQNCIFLEDTDYPCCNIKVTLSPPIDLKLENIVNKENISGKYFLIIPSVGSSFSSYKNMKNDNAILNMNSLAGDSVKTSYQPFKVYLPTKFTKQNHTGIIGLVNPGSFYC